MSPNPLGTTDPASDRDLRVVDLLVRALGSSLDVRDIAARALPILASELDYDRADLLIVDELSRELKWVGSTEVEVEERVFWPLERSLSERLRTSSGCVRIEAEELPPGLASAGGRIAMRLTDGSAVVGLVVLPRCHLVEPDGEDQGVLVRTIGGLVGSIIGRSLVHETLLRVTDRLDSARRLQQHVLDHVSHEFNTPLMILKSAAEFLDTDDAEERAGFLDMHRQAMDRLEQLVQGVLEVARTRSDAHWHVVSGDELHRAVLQSVLDRDPWRTELLVHHFDVPGSFLVGVDVEGLVLVVDHLLRNAWSFAVQSGHHAGLGVFLDRHVRSADLDARMDSVLEALAAGQVLGAARPEKAGDRLVIEVVDDGIGIPPDELEFVFEPFAQARNSPLRGISGAGMGLPVARKRSETMGGRLRLVSELGRGTLVRVEIPLERTGR